MPFIVIKMPAEPVLLVGVDLADPNRESILQGIKAEISRYADESVPLYVIVSLAGQDLTMIDVQLALGDAVDAPRGSLADKRLRPVIVGDHPMVQILQDRLFRQFDITLACFDTTASALAYVRATIERGSPPPPVGPSHSPPDLLE